MHKSQSANKVGRQPLRDQCLLRLIYRHGLRASEAKDARWTVRPYGGVGPKDIPCSAPEGVSG